MRIVFLLLLLGCHESTSSLPPVAASLIGVRAEEDTWVLEEYVLGADTVETVARIPRLNRPALSMSTDGETALVWDLDTNAGVLVNLESGATTELRYSGSLPLCDSFSSMLWIDGETFLRQCVTEATPWVGSVDGEVVPLSDLIGDCRLELASGHHQRLLLRCPDGDFLADGRGRRVVEIQGLSDPRFNARIVSPSHVAEIQEQSDGRRLYRHGSEEPVPGVLVPLDPPTPGLGAGPALFIGWHGQSVVAFRSELDSEAFRSDGSARLTLPRCTDGSPPDTFFLPDPESILRQCDEALTVHTFEQPEVRIDVGESGWTEVSDEHLLFRARVETAESYEVYDMSTGELIDEWPGSALVVRWRRQSF